MLAVPFRLSSYPTRPPVHARSEIQCPDPTDERRIRRLWPPRRTRGPGRSVMAGDRRRFCIRPTEANGRYVSTTCGRPASSEPSLNCLAWVKLHRRIRLRWRRNIGRWRGILSRRGRGIETQWSHRNRRIDIHTTAERGEQRQEAPDRIIHATGC
jgi:hypothetical protein